MRVLVGVRRFVVARAAFAFAVAARAANDEYRGCQLRRVVLRARW